MNRKGFTLPEILGVIVLLSIIAIISISQITNRVNSTKGKISDAQEQLILSATKLFVDENRLEYKKEEGNVYCILVQSVIDGGYLTSPILDVEGKEIDYNTKIKASYINDKFDFEYNPSGCNRKYENGTPIYFNPVTNLVCTEGEANKNMNSNGTPTGIKAGCMKWYTFNDSSDSDTVNLILDHNTTPTVAWNSENANTKMKEVQDALVNDTKTWNENVKKTARLILVDEIVKIINSSKFNSNSQSITYFYFDTDSENSNCIDASGSGICTAGKSKYAWLFDYTRNCTAFGCNVIDNTDNLFGYWTSNSVSGTTNKNWSVDRSGSFYSRGSNAVTAGLRPVITLPKTILQ